MGRQPAGGVHHGEPWLPVTANHTEINAETALADPASVFHHYRRLIELRRELAVVRDRAFDLLLPDHEQVFAYTRTLDGQVLVMLANLSDDPVDLPADGLPELAGAELLLTTHEDVVPGQLRPWESQVFLLG